MPNIDALGFIAKTATSENLQSRAIHYFLRKLQRLNLALLSRPPHPMVDSSNEAIAKQIIRAATKNPASFIYLMAGETQLGTTFSKTDKSVRKRTIICLHQPPSYLRLNYRDFSDFDGLGGIVCLSTAQKIFIESVCSTPAILSRHGVCLDFFAPNEAKTDVEKAKLLMVGEWLRDFEVLAASMEQIWKTEPETTLDCVLRHSARKHPALYRLARDDRVRWHADISPEKLRDLYQKATLLFLPLIDASANNAIVEAMACGLPIITTRVGGMPDYVVSEIGELCPPDNALAHAAAVLRWLPDKKRRILAGLAGRKFAVEKLDWKIISHDLINEIHAKSLLD